MSFLSKIFGGGGAGKPPAQPPQPTWLDRFAEAGPHAGYAVELRAPGPVGVNAQALLDKVRETQPTADLIGEGGQLFGIAFPEHPIQLADRTICYSVQVITGINPPAAELEASLSQTWLWPEKRQVAPRLKHVVRLNDMGGGHLAGATRVKLVTDVLHAVWGHSEAAGHAFLDGAVHWIPAQHVLPFQKWVVASEVIGPAAYAVNVRLFNVGDGVAGETLMDTMGLAALGLPDLQCWFTALEPGEVAPILRALAGKLLAGEDIPDGEELTLEDTPFKARKPWRIERAEAKAKPGRDMLSLIPGEYAAQ